MSIALYDLSVASYLQIITAVEKFLQHGADHCAQKGIDPNEIVETRLYPDMNPFRFQVFCIAHHSRGAIEGVKSGIFRPPYHMPQGIDYPALQFLVSQARKFLQALTPAEVNALEGLHIDFDLGDTKIPFSAENFLMSFSLPNFYFHTTTAYDILRMKGVPLGKRDFIGALRKKV